MSSPTQTAQLPPDLAHLAAHPRVQVRRSGPPRTPARSIVYWMQRAQRILDNPALDVAIQAGNLLGLPVVVYFQVIPNYPNANLRHYHFLQQGLRDVAADAAARGVGFVLRRTPESSSKPSLKRSRPPCSSATKTPAANPSAGVRCPPNASSSPTGPSTPTSSSPPASSIAASSCSTTSARISRPSCPPVWSRLQKTTPLHPGSRPRSSTAYPLDRTSPPASPRLIAPSVPSTALPEAHTPPSSASTTFVNLELKDYETTRNHPELPGTSRLSPYLHFGNIGPLTIALAVKQAVSMAKAPAARATSTSTS